MKAMESTLVPMDIYIARLEKIAIRKWPSVKRLER